MGKVKKIIKVHMWIEKPGCLDISNMNLWKGPWACFHVILVITALKSSAACIWACNVQLSDVFLFVSYPAICSLPLQRGCT